MQNVDFLAQKLNEIRSVEKFIHLGGFIGNLSEQKCKELCKQYIAQMASPVLWNEDKQGLYRKMNYEDTIQKAIFQYKAGAIKSITDEKSEFIQLTHEIVGEEGKCLEK